MQVIKPCMRQTEDAARSVNDANAKMPLETPYGTLELNDKNSTPPYVYLITSLAVIAGFLFGYDTGVVAGAMLVLRHEWPTQINDVWQGAIVAITMGSAAISAFLSGPLNDRFGRRLVIIAASFAFTLGALVLGAAPDRYGLLIGRIIVGIGIGIQ